MGGDFVDLAGFPIADEFFSVPPYLCVSPAVFYSARSASTGCTRSARRVGTTQATMHTASISSP